MQILRNIETLNRLGYHLIHMNILNAIDDFLSKIEKWIIIALLSFLMVVAFLQVVLRNFFRRICMGGYIVAQYCFVVSAYRCF